MKRCFFPIHLLLVSAVFSFLVIFRFFSPSGLRFCLSCLFLCFQNLLAILTRSISFSVFSQPLSVFDHVSFPLSRFCCLFFVQISLLFLFLLPFPHLVLRLLLVL